MEFLKFEKVRDGKYLKNYELTYRNKAGREKKYEIVSRRELAGIEDVGGKPSGVSIVATYGDRMLLLHEFRMGVNRTVYNLCAGMLEPDESIEDCIARELYEETGLKVKTDMKSCSVSSFWVMPFSFRSLVTNVPNSCLSILNICFSSCRLSKPIFAHALHNATEPQENAIFQG